MPSGPIRILLLESPHKVARENLERAGFFVESEDRALSEVELLERAKGFHVLGIRSKTQVTGDVLKGLPRLMSVGAFCIGTNQIDLQAANLLGKVVFNAPYSNTRSVAELVIAELIALSRQLFDRSQGAHHGDWIKSADGSHEVRGKVLGIVGYGHIGTQVSILAEALGMHVIFYDIVKKLPIGNARPMESLDSLLSEADFVTLHVPETDLTKGMLGHQKISLMKRGAHLLNLSRGMVVDIKALASAIESKKLGGAAVDVFPGEPSSNKERFKSELQGLRNVILTPHIGGSTEEAQENIGNEVSETLRRFLKFGATGGAVNFPQIEVPEIGEFRRMINIHQNVPGVLGAVNGIVSKLGVNIRRQYLSTDQNIGYLIMDMEAGDAERVAQEVKVLSTSIRTKVLR